MPLLSFFVRFLTHAKTLMLVIIDIRCINTRQVPSSLDEFVAVAAVLHERVGPTLRREAARPELLVEHVSRQGFHLPRCPRV